MPPRGSLRPKWNRAQQARGCPIHRDRKAQTRIKENSEPKHKKNLLENGEPGSLTLFKLIIFLVVFFFKQ